MFKKILIGLAVVLIAFAVFANSRPADFKITRSAVIAAAPAKVFAQVNDFHLWANWSPWEKMDTSMKKTFEGPAMGQGSVYSWVGNNKVGEGKMTLTASHPSDLIQIQLDFLKPMKDTCQTEFAFAPQGTGTQVTWSMTGKRNFVSKAFCVFLDMDKMVGGDFERGLASLKAVSEAASKK